jgi:hypothetical protein
MKGFDINALINNHCLDFKTTTTRTIGLRLDLESGVLRCWLNGNLLEKKGVGITGERLKAGVWYPYVTLKGMGN